MVSLGFFTALFTVFHEANLVVSNNSMNTVSVVIYSEAHLSVDALEIDQASNFLVDQPDGIVGTSFFAEVL